MIAAKCYSKVLFFCKDRGGNGQEVLIRYNIFLYTQSSFPVKCKMSPYFQTLVDCSPLPHFNPTTINRRGNVNFGVLATGTLTLVSLIEDTFAVVLNSNQFKNCKHESWRLLSTYFSTRELPGVALVNFSTGQIFMGKGNPLNYIDILIAQKINSFLPKTSK